MQAFWRNIVMFGALAATFVFWHVAAPSQPAGERPTSEVDGQDEAAAGRWLTGTPDENYDSMERHLRGMDVAMVEIGYRYGELLAAAGTRNWDYARYQTEKTDLVMRLALERRPKRAKSAHSFLDTDLPAVLTAVKHQDGTALDKALDLLHASCVQCHTDENVQYFREAVQRIRDESVARQQRAKGAESRSVQELQLFGPNRP